MPYPWRVYPTLAAEHLQDARLFASRWDMLASFERMRGGKVVAEVGVAFGDFSDFLLKTLRPSRFVAFDLFNMHDWPLVWNKPPSERLGDMKHEDFYRKRFADYPVETVAGKSWETLPRFADQSFDLIYVDADHEYDGVKRDTLQAERLLKPGGIIVMNDYIMYDHAGELPYGVVQATNELIVEHGFKVIGFSLEANMFCDIAITR